MNIKYYLKSIHPAIFWIAIAIPQCLAVAFLVTRVNHGPTNYGRPLLVASLVSLVAITVPLLLASAVLQRAKDYIRERVRWPLVSLLLVLVFLLPIYGKKAPDPIVELLTKTWIFLAISIMAFILVFVGARLFPSTFARVEAHSSLSNWERKRVLPISFFLLLAISLIWVDIWSGNVKGQSNEELMRSFGAAVEDEDHIAAAKAMKELCERDRPENLNQRGLLLINCETIRGVPINEIEFSLDRSVGGQVDYSGIARRRRR